MTKEAEVIVVGLGAMGSAALYYLAKLGIEAIGVDAYHPPHAHGSTHGETRLFRTAYFEHENYVPLLKRAQRLWLELNRETGREIFCQSGLVLAGDPEASAILRNSRASARKHAIPVANLAADELRQRFPWFSWPDSHEAIFEPGAGYIHAELAVEKFLEACQEHVEVRTNCPVTAVKPHGKGWQIECKSVSLRARKVIWTAGPWSSRWVRGWSSELRLYRMIVHWFNCHHDLQKIPCFGYDRGDRFFYGFPSLDGRTFKMADHTPENQIASPESCGRSVSAQECAKVIEAAGQLFPAATKGELARSETCIYTMTPDEHFFFDYHPDSQQMFVAAGFSGHGFKFATVIGEALAAWAAGQGVHEDFAFLSRKRA